jgi:hypothetical protein
VVLWTLSDPGIVVWGGEGVNEEVPAIYVFALVFEESLQAQGINGRKVEVPYRVGDVVREGCAE